MSKRKNKSTASPPPKMAAPANKLSTARANRTAPPSALPRQRIWLIGLLTLILLLAVGLFFWRRSSQPSAATPAQPTTTPALTIHRPIGNVNACRTFPAFVATLGFSRTAFVSTDARPQKGATLIEQDAKGNIIRTYQHPSWSTAGYMGPPVVDKFGNIFLIPAPWINVLDNPTIKQNIIYKIDTKTGIMADYVHLPAAAEPSTENPYGLLGLSYDCDTQSLYATSVAGSTRNKEVGRIFQIDGATGKVLDQLDNIDAFGVMGFNGAKGKRLYFGMARTSDIRSILLDDNGHFVGESRVEFSLAGLGAHGDEKGQRLSVDTDKILSVRSLEFDFNLIAPTELRRTLFKYTYNANSDAWSLADSVPLQ
ncbi:MAG: hypothetical protein NT075_19230 [Chloroflexi bacterium]|nr:hypothetical protein [Chloroflexota bacterium]